MFNRLVTYLLVGRKLLVGRSRGWWAAVTETIVSAALVVIGVVMLATFVTLAVIYSSPDQLYISVWYFVVQLIVAIGLILIGSYMILSTLWKVGASVERREALVSRAGEIELFNELRTGFESLPSVPRDKYAPIRGDRFRYQLLPSRRNTWGFVFAAALAVLFLSLATILILTAMVSFERRSPDWLAVALATAFSLASIWTTYQFTRQFLLMTGMGIPALEIDSYPVYPGRSFRLLLSQPGRVRLKLLEVNVVCEEVVTFNEGTDVRTERRVVYEQRLMRKRGLLLKPYAPFEQELEFSIPQGSMHSFKSANNRVRWKIVILGESKGWPVQERRFTISVLPPSEAIES